MASNKKLSNAFKVTRALDIPDDEVKPVLEELLKVYDKSWELIEAEEYRVLIDSYFELKESKGRDDQNDIHMKDDKYGRPPKKLCVEDKEDHVSSTRDKVNQNLSWVVDDNKFLMNDYASERHKKVHVKEKEKQMSSSGDKVNHSVALANDGDKVHMKNYICEKPPKKLLPKEKNQLCFTSNKVSQNIARVKDGDVEITTSTVKFRGPRELTSDPNRSKRSELPVKQLFSKFKNSTAETALLESYPKHKLYGNGPSLHLEKKTCNSYSREPTVGGTEQIANDLTKSAVKKVGDSLHSLGPNNEASGSSNSNMASRKKALKFSNVPQKRFIPGENRNKHWLSDITKGTENIKISLVGNEELPKFTYIPQNIVYQGAYVHISLARVSDMDCCSSCSGDCLSSSIPCACTSETGGEFAYTREGLLKDGFLNTCILMKHNPEDHHFVFCQECPIERAKNDYIPEDCKGHLVRKFIKECWRKCGCDMTCGNRVVQRGISCNLEVFSTAERKGWGVRTLKDLPKGTFVCEYVGEIVTNMELYERNLKNNGSDKHTYPVTLDADWGSEKVLKDEEALCLDATFSGNVARFINHRCEDANLIDIPVEIETPDRHYYHLAFFTARKVNALEELTWDYGIDFSDHNHPIKAFSCLCGSASCRDAKQKDDSRLSTRLIFVPSDPKK
ncbi:hypothetical protein K2173_011522 [Erythroxylum novogranatense]|uniref:Histone-lysine N-methyltransferase SUVR4 n=1 Tax=Erythroxylum novogranatense TaxID=1862640 RepID=A0AAV8TT97_9ROSI|nr:hypothetical protein K2173_011522 [Erythroxylum novogranatense]